MRQTKEVKAILEEIGYRIKIGSIRKKILRGTKDVLSGKKTKQKLSDILENKVNELRDIRAWITNANNK